MKTKYLVILIGLVLACVLTVAFVYADADSTTSIAPSSELIKNKISPPYPPPATKLPPYPEPRKPTATLKPTPGIIWSVNPTATPRPEIIIIWNTATP